MAPQTIGDKRTAVINSPSLQQIASEGTDQQFGKDPFGMCLMAGRVKRADSGFEDPIENTRWVATGTREAVI
jgi:hypothetical protein